ncbi:MAG: hypothetical protein A2020_01455 [Lentisphaerae bacterium GWF2_45_14]|nr:MAG: hypothetical protein A2020_01455 [Lentisphaerae bacterium GWF2_45_14]
MIQKLLKQLNAEQAEAASSIEGPLLVLAGAGTGKTRVITYRIGCMIQNGISPANILGVTFTNKAAREMKERLAQLIGAETAKKVTLGTFHSFCARLLRREIDLLGYDSRFTIADDSDQNGLIRQALGELGISTEEISVDAALGMIGRWKNAMLEPKDASNVAETEREIKTAAVYARYQQYLENQNIVDFDDLLFFVVKIWRKYPEKLRKYQDIYKYILVDEYQDTNMVQFELLKMLVGENKNICVVGDDDQSIYGWRGAVVENILNFPHHFKGAKVVKLEKNYRSTNKILQAANKVIAVNQDRYQKNLWSDNGEGENIKIVRTESADEEAQFIAEAVQETVLSNHEMSYKDIAVLYRSNHLSRVLERALREYRVPFKLVGGQEFFGRKEIKDAAAYLKLIVNPKEDQSFLRILSVPPRGIGDKAVKKLKELQGQTFIPYSELVGHDSFLSELSSAGKSNARALYNSFLKYRNLFSSPGNLAEKMQKYFEEAGYYDGFQKLYKNRDEAEKRQANVDEFISAAAEFESRAAEEVFLMDFLESFSLLDENDKTEDEEQNADTVTLTTVHAAKGLEFPCVFLVGMEDKIFPHERSVKEGNTDEELRLFYVAITRAKTNLCITYASSRFMRGQFQRKMPSHFLRLLPDDSIEKIKGSDFFRSVDKDEVLEGLQDIFKVLKGES